LKPGIGYLRIASFDEKTGGADPERIESLGRQKAERTGARSAEQSGRLADIGVADGVLVLKPA